MKWAPNTLITLFGGILFYKSFIAYTSFIWVALPIPMILLQLKSRMNLLENCAVTVKAIYLQNSGTKIEVIDIIGVKKIHPISTLSFPSEA